MRRIRVVNKKRFVATVILLSIGITSGSVYAYNTNKYNTLQETQILSEQVVVKNETPIDNTYQINKKPNYDLQLEQKYQDLIYNLCDNNNLSYELVLSVQYVESKFNTDAVNINKNNTRDFGLFQLNSKFLEEYRTYAIQYCWLSKDIKFDVTNPDHNIRAGIGLLVHLRDYYKDKGMSDEQMYYYIVNSFHQGKEGYLKDVKRTGTLSRGYDRRVSEVKEQLETTNSIK